MKFPTVFLLLVTVCFTQARTYDYDDSGRLIRVAYPTGEGIAYTYDEAGNLLLVEALTLPAAPSALTATRSESEVVLNWADNSSDETGFQVFRRVDGSRSSAQWSLISTLAANTRSYTDTDIFSQARYEYRVVATSSNGPSADSNLVEAIDSNARPFEFTDQALSLMSEEAIELTLTLTTVNGNAYSVEESKDLIRWETVKSITNAEDVFFNSAFFLGHPDNDTTTVTIELPGSTERKFFRPVRN